MSGRIPLISFKTINECVQYLKPLPTGTQCILTGGPFLGSKSRAQFLQRGFDVKLDGKHGERTVTGIGIDTTRVDKHSEWKSSKDKDGLRITLGEAGGKVLLPGQSVFANGTHATVIRELRKAYGAGNYSCVKFEHPKYGVGWLVAHLDENQKQERKKLEETRLAKLQRSQEFAADNRIHTAKAMGTGIEVGASVFVQSQRARIRDHLRLRFKPQKFDVEPATHETLGECFKVTRTA
jgi:hypothetical protein